MCAVDRPKFMVDQNVGKLVKWLRLMGYDAVFFEGETDTEMVSIALAENRIILTRDTHIPERRLVIGGQVKVVLFETDEPGEQIRILIENLRLGEEAQPFTRCLEDNQILEARSKEEVEKRVPPYVFETREQYMECPKCHRIYWKGTHWQAMNRTLEEFIHLPPNLPHRDKGG
jgi:uncharacterized protein